MDYELAKQLKDAGFPGYEEDWVDDVGHIVLHPTLSELIEACGSRFKSIERHELPKVGYHAYAKTPPFPVSLSCDTPEEAVAGLWLELNKKTK